VLVLVLGFSVSVSVRVLSSYRGRAGVSEQAC